MTLRLVLVSLVAALGLTIPGVPMIESWVASTQNWMNARFADWDTRNPDTPDYVIVSDYYDAGRLAPHQQIPLPLIATTPSSSSDQEAPRVDPAGATNFVPEVTAVTVAAHITQVRPASFVRKLDVFKPIEVSERLCLGFAEELNHRSDGLHVATAPTIPASRPRAPIAWSRLASSVSRSLTSALVRWNTLAASLPVRGVVPSQGRRRSEPLMVFEDLYGGPPCKLPKAVEAQARHLAARTVAIEARTAVSLAPTPAKAQGPAPRPASTMVRGFGPMETSPSLYFSGELKVATKPILSSSPAPAVVPATNEQTKPAPRPIAAGPSKPAPVAEARKAPALPTLSQDATEDLDIEVAGALSPQLDGFGTVTPTAPKQAVVPAPKSRFEPLEAGPETGIGIAYELNRRSEGLDFQAPRFPAETRVATSPSRPTRELHRAVKLTREAVYAWLNVFTGPALVTVSQSKDQPLGR